MDYNNWNMFWSVCFGVMAILIVFGNCLSILILLKRRLRKRPHFLLISLAMADLLVGLLAIPIYIVMWLSRQTLVSSLVFDCVDMFTGFSSVFTLVFISLERLYAIALPFRHRLLALHSYFIAIATPWILSLAVTSCRVLLELAIIDFHQFLSVIITSLSTPLVIMCIAYCVIWRKEASRLYHTFRARNEARLSKTVLLVTGMFILTWMPFQVLVIVIVKCATCKNVSLAVVFVIKLLQFSNSVLNFFIYCFRMPNYRHALFSLLPSSNCCRFRNGVVHPFVESQTTSITILSFSTSTSLNRCQQSQKNARAQTSPDT